MATENTPVSIGVKIAEIDISTETTTAIAVGCDACPNRRMLVARGMAGLAAAKSLAEIPGKVATNTKISVEGTTVRVLSDRLENSDPRPHCSPADQCGYADQISESAAALERTIGDKGIPVSHIAYPAERR